MSRRPRISQGPKPKGKWREKVHPFFSDMMHEYKQMERLGKSSSEEDRLKAQQWARGSHEEWRRRAREVGEEFRRTGKVQRNIAAKILDLDLVEDSEVKEPADDQFMLSWLSWFKYGKTWRQLQHERNGGSWKASQQVLAVIRDFEKWKFGKIDPNGLQFKIDRTHFTLMAFGLDFGLDDLTPDELADCFDWLCSCEKQEHDPENLRKLRDRIFQSLKDCSAEEHASSV